MYHTVWLGNNLKHLEVVAESFIGVDTPQHVLIGAVMVDPVGSRLHIVAHIPFYCSIAETDT